MKILLTLVIFTNILLADSNNTFDIQGVIDMRTKHMDIQYSKTGKVEQEYNSAEFRPRMSYLNKEYGFVFSTEAVMRITDGDGIIDSKSTPHFYPDFSHQVTGEDIYLKSMYIGKRFEAGGINHEIGLGLPPFTSGWPYEYKEHNIVRGSGIAPLIQMTAESVYYYGDFTSLTKYDRVHFIAAISQVMDIIPTNPDFENSNYKDSYGATLFLQIDNDKHLFKLMYTYDKLKYMNDYENNPEPSDRVWTLGDTHILGFGYAYDDYDYGLTYYNVAAFSYHKSDSSDSVEMLSNLETHIDQAIAAGKMPAGIKDEITNGDSSTGWSNLLGIRKEFDIDSIDKTFYVGAEWFTTSKDWFTKSVDTPSSSIYNLNTKGDVYTLYTGIYLKSNMSINFGYSRVKNKWVNEIGSVNVGYDIENSMRDIYETNDIYSLQFVWDF